MDLKLVMFKATGQRKDFLIENPVTVIGRGEDCGLRVPVLSVSRRHSELKVSEDAVTIRDLGSSNGTYVNNQLVTEGELNAGDRLAIGPIIFTVQVDGVPEEIQPVKTRAQRLAESSVVGTEPLLELEAEEVSHGDSEGTAAEVRLEEAEVVPTAKAAAAEVGDDDVIAALEALADDDEDGPGN